MSHPKKKQQAVPCACERLEKKRDKLKDRELIHLWGKDSDGEEQRSRGACSRTKLKDKPVDVFFARLNTEMLLKQSVMYSEHREKL